MSGCGLIILAAGASARMGVPKQLLAYRGKTLLRHAVETGLASRCRPVVVVLGADAQRLGVELEGLPVQVVENTDWESGMGASIRAGIEALALMSDSGISAAILMLGDMPLLSPETLDSLVATQEETQCLLVASEYDHTLGAPALFHRSLFPELLSLTGAEGAKQVILKHRQEAAIVPFPEGLVDIDTPEDYQRICDPM